MLLGPDRHVLLLTLHHVLADGWSMDVLARELGALYAAAAAGPAGPAAAAAGPVRRLRRLAARLAVRRGRRAAGRVLAQTLAGAPALLELPTDLPRPAEQDYRGGQLAVEFDAELTAALHGAEPALGLHRCS